MRRPASATRRSVAPAAAGVLAGTLLAVGPAPTRAQPAPSGEACTEIRVEGLTVGRGRLQVALFDSEAAFRKDALVALTIRVGSASTWRSTLCGLPAEVAVVVTQDVDGDGELDTNVVGIPREPWGASGRGTLGPPSWKSARVATTAPVVVTLR